MVQKRRFSTDDEDNSAPWSDEDSPKFERRTRRSAAADEESEQDGDDSDTIVPFVTGRRKIKESRPQSEGSSMYFRWPDEGESVVVKFLDADPWAYNQHWVTRAGKQSFPCIGKDCPLCEIGSKVSQKIVYTIVNLSGDEPLIQILEVTPTLDETLVGYDEDSKTGPLNRLFWALSRTKGSRSKSFAKYNYSFLPIKERDLKEDWDLDPDSFASFLSKAEAPEPSKVLGKISRKDLQEIADEAMA